MRDTLPSDEPVTKTTEVKPSLTIRYAVLLILSTVITSSVAFWVARTWERTTVDKKMLVLTIVPSHNLAAMPANVASTLEFRIAVSPTEKQVIRSLFGYQIGLRNHSREAVENLTLHLYPPPNVKLIDPPIITTDSKILKEFVTQSKRVLDKEAVFDLDLLGAGQEITVAYSGYSEEAIAGVSEIDAETRKNGWEVRKMTPGYTEYYYVGGFEPYGNGGFFSKRIAAYDGADVVSLFLLLVTVTGIFGFMVWLLARALSDLFKSLQSWRSAFDRLFRRM